jgi:hypothetical protein
VSSTTIRERAKDRGFYKEKIDKRNEITITSQATG